jgi:hypothetical protein
MAIVMQGLSIKYNCIYFALERLPSFLKGEHLFATMMVYGCPIILQMFQIIDYG